MDELVGRSVREIKIILKVRAEADYFVRSGHRKQFYKRHNDDGITELIASLTALTASMAQLNRKVEALRQCQKIRPT